MTLHFTKEALCEALLNLKEGFDRGQEWESAMACSRSVHVLYSRQENKFMVWCPHVTSDARFDSFEEAVIHAVRISLSHEHKYPA